MKTVDIKGKPYVMVNERLKTFREGYENYSLVTEIVELNAAVCVLQAKILDPNGRIVATGTAREEREDRNSMVNRTSYVENCETSAWGRALGNFGIGIDESIATAEEVARAIEKQENMRKSESKTDSEEIPEMPYEKALNYKTKSGTPFYELTDEYLLKITESNARADSKAAAYAILHHRHEDENLRPIDEEDDLPF